MPIDYADPVAPAPSLGAPPGKQQLERERGIGRQILLSSALPMVISVGVNALFFVSYWIPELDAFPGHDFWFNQVAPLAAKHVVAGGQALAPVQAHQVGIAPALLLVCSLLIRWMARSHYWLARTWIWAPVLVGDLAAVISILVLWGRGDLGRCFLGAVLLGVWAFASTGTARAALAVDIDALPARTPRSGLVWLIVYIALGAPATAVGRWLFAPELRDSALALQANTVALHTAALGISANGWVFVSGMLVGVCVWLIYQFVPPRRDAPTIVRGVVLVVALLITIPMGVTATSPAGLALSDRLAADSPAGHLTFTCATWVVDPAAPVKQTLVVDGWECRRTTLYTGYRQQFTHETEESAAPVTVRTPEGQDISSKLVAASYGDTLVQVLGDRGTLVATSIVGYGMADGAPRWHFSCPSGATPLTVRFAGAGDEPTRGRITRGKEGASIVVGCGGERNRLDPRTGAEGG